MRKRPVAGVLRADLQRGNDILICRSAALTSRGHRRRIQLVGERERQGSSKHTKGNRKPNSTSVSSSSPARVMAVTILRCEKLLTWFSIITLGVTQACLRGRLICPGAHRSSARGEVSRVCGSLAPGVSQVCSGEGCNYTLHPHIGSDVL